MYFLFFFLFSSLLPLFSAAATKEQVTKQVRKVLLTPQVDQESVDKIATEVQNRMCNQKHTLSQIIHGFPEIVKGRVSNKLVLLGLQSYKGIKPCYQNSGSDFETQMKKLGTGFDVCMEKLYKEAQKLCKNLPKAYEYILKEFKEPNIKKCMSEIKKQQNGTPCPKCFQCSKDNSNTLFNYPAGI